MEQTKRQLRRQTKSYKSWYRLLFGGLFWRTFLFIALLITVSLFAWFQSFKSIEREPRALHIAMQLVSIVKLTKTALLYSDPHLIQSLLQDLESNEGVRVYPHLPNDQYILQPDTPLNRLIKYNIKTRLGERTLITKSVNHIPGVWISFKINQDHYWVTLDREQLDSTEQIEWPSWSIFALLLSLCGAALITSLVNYPFSSLASAARQVGQGLYPKPLPEAGNGVIAQTNHSFNQMVKDLEQLEADRLLMLAGISHDLKTPLARLRLETEMSTSDEQTKQAMVDDIEQMDHIISAFIDYAQPSTKSQQEIDLFPIIQKNLINFQQNKHFIIQLNAQKGLIVHANQTDIQRILNNIFANAKKYGVSEEDQKVHIDIMAIKSSDSVQLTIRDYGPGIAQEYLPLITRPFYRVNPARSQCDGTGLGMAIVQRIISNLGGTLTIQNAKNQTGLEIIVCLPSASTKHKN